jgi:hypothetical protein
MQLTDLKLSPSNIVCDDIRLFASSMGSGQAGQPAWFFRLTFSAVGYTGMFTLTL